MLHLRRDYDGVQDIAKWVDKLPQELHARIHNSGVHIPTPTSIADDEPVFLVRAKDICMPGTVEAWANLADVLGADYRLIERVREWAEVARTWQRSHPETKRPDAPIDKLRLPLK